MHTGTDERPEVAGDEGASPAPPWEFRNQRHLALAAEAVAAAVDGRAAAAASASGAAAVVAAETLALTGRPVALDDLAQLFALTPFERCVLVAAAAGELGLTTPDPPVTFSLLLGALPEPHWSALLPDAPLRAWRLLDLPHPLPPARQGGLAGSPLSLDERVLHALIGAETIDERLTGYCEPLGVACALSPGQLHVVAHAAELLHPARSADPVVLQGQDRETRREAAVDAGRLLGLSALAVDAALLPDDPARLDLLTRLLVREAGLGRRLLVVETSDDDLPRAEHVLDAGPMSGLPRVLSVDGSRPHPRWAGVQLPTPTVPERRDLLASALADSGIPVDHPDLVHAVGTAAEQRRLTAAGLGQVVRRLAQQHPLAAIADPAVLADELVTGARRQTTTPLAGLATVRDPTTRLAELILPAQTRRALHAIIAHVRQGTKVLDEWGYGERERGLATTALFSGASGTGKTSAAEALARELGRELVVVDLSQVVSKYIGDTEKNLATLFDAAEAGAVLLFDEGEALFGRRTQVRDSHDRYANIEVAFLLQRLETFRGIAIVTTNVREQLDPAFQRRMRFVVPFVFPEQEQRVELWRGAFPASVPAEGLDPVRLAQLSVSAGTIAQIALHATFLAADEGSPVRMSHLLDAAQVESDKLGRPLQAAETRGWV